jgi:hypothetical protein
VVKRETVFPLTVQTELVEDVKETSRPDEDVASTVNRRLPRSTSLTVGNTIVWASVDVSDTLSIWLLFPTIARSPEGEKLIDPPIL